MVKMSLENESCQVFLGDPVTCRLQKALLSCQTGVMLFLGKSLFGQMDRWEEVNYGERYGK